MQVSTWPSEVQISHFTCNNFGCKLGCDQSRIMLEIVSKLLHTAIWSGCAVNWNLRPGRHPFQEGKLIWICLQCLHRIQFTRCWFVFPYFLLRLQGKIKKIREAMSAALVGTKFLYFTFKNRICGQWLIIIQKWETFKTSLTLYKSVLHEW